MVREAEQLEDLLNINYNTVANFLRQYMNPGMFVTKCLSGYPANITAPAAHFIL